MAADAVVIGAGPNGLVAANVLADAGWAVLVLEAGAEPGGAVRSAELIEPGYVNDVFSAFYPLAAASTAMTRLRLEDHGLSWARAPLALAHPATDGTCPIISTDPDETAASLDAAAPGAGDGDAWRHLVEQWRRVGRAVLDTLLGPFPPVRKGARLLGRLRPSELLPFARFLVLPVRTMGEELFASGAARRLIAGNALHTDLSPDATLSGAFGWVLSMLAQDVGFPVPEGGAGRLTAALVARLESAGGRVLCASRVDRIVVRGGRAVAVRLADGTEVDAGRAVLADVAAPALYLDLIGPEHLPAGLVDRVRHCFHWDNATVKVDWNLDGPIPWLAEGARRAGTVHVADGVDDLTRAAAALSTGQVPERPFLLLGQQSMTDPTRQPAGKETAWAYTHVPRGVTIEPSRLAARMESLVEELAPGFGDLVRGRHVLGPDDLEARDHNLVGGAVNGGTAQLHQMLAFRPVPGLARPRTPVAGLYLASSSAHPGGGVHGACGANAAAAALRGNRPRRTF